VERQTTSSGFAFFPPLFGIKLAHKPLAERQQNAVGYSPSFSLLQFKAVKDRLIGKSRYIIKPFQDCLVDKKISSIHYFSLPPLMKVFK
jgi:hypothetical protein